MLFFSPPIADTFFVFFRKRKRGGRERERESPQRFLADVSVNHIRTLALHLLITRRKKKKEKKEKRILTCAARTLLRAVSVGNSCLKRKKRKKEEREKEGRGEDIERRKEKSSWPIQRSELYIS